MNQRIEALKARATTREVGYDKNHEHCVTEVLDAEKFAELIINDVVELIQDDTATSINYDIIKAILKVKITYGVK